MPRTKSVSLSAGKLPPDPSIRYSLDSSSLHWESCVISMDAVPSPPSRQFTRTSSRSRRSPRTVADSSS